MEAKWFSPIQPVANGKSESQNRKCKFAQRTAPETFVEAETHAQETAAVNEPLAITREVQPSPVETHAPANDGAAAPDAANPDVLKDAKAS